MSRLLIPLAVLLLLTPRLMAQPTDQDTRAYLTVKVPADAKVLIDDHPTKATGEVRQFETPPLDPAKKYSYMVKAIFKGKDGKEVVVEEKVMITPGKKTEVDLTKPKIQGWKAGLGKNGHLDIRWKITDKNLGNQAVNLFYRTGHTGAWKPMATKLKSEGSFRWSITQDLAPQYYIRLEATDLAGNLTHVESQNPVLVDRTAPDINVTGVSVIQNQPTEPTDNLVPASGEAHDGNE